MEQRREDILATAYRLFGERGYHDTNISDIADALKIGHGTFYRYYQNKRDIFVQVIDLVVAKIAGVVAAEEPATRTLADYRAQLERIGERLFDLFAADQHLAQILFYEAPGIDRALDQKIRAAIDLFASFTERYLVNGKKRGFLRRDLDTSVTALAINAMIFEGVRRVQAAPSQRRAKDQWVRAVTQLLLQGMAA